MPRSRINVLVVDDSEEHRLLYAAMLQQDPTTQYVLTECATGAEAIAHVRTQVPDCILLDFFLRDGNAVELLDQLAKIVDLAALPVVVTSVDDDQVNIDRAFRAGAVDFVHKGRITAGDLSRSLRYAVERARNQDVRSQLARSQRLMSLGQVAASVAHEINNPAAFVLSNLVSLQQILQQLKPLLDPPEPLTDKAIDLIGELESITQDNIDGVRRIAAIVSELRLFSHPKTESVERVDLNDVVRIATKLLGSKLQSAGRLLLTLDPIPAIAADRGRMVQVLVNLLDNAAVALKDAPGKEHEIRVRTRTQGDWIEVSVEDTGPGMSQEVAAHAFEPFFTTKGAGVGTGLGLSLCAEYVHQHGGEIELDSTENQGTTVIVRIPRRTGLVPSSERLPLSQKARSTRGHVVIIDDEQPLLRAFQRVLAGHHTVVTFERARDAISALRAGLAATAIICDVNMPDLDGPSVHYEIQEFDPELARRMIFCTGGAFSENSRSLLDQTGLLVLSKPVEPSTLLRAIDQMWATSERSRAAD